MYNTGDPEREPLGDRRRARASTSRASSSGSASSPRRNQRAKSAAASTSMSGCRTQRPARTSTTPRCTRFQGAIRRRYYSRHIFGYPNDIMACEDGYVVVIPGAGGFRSPMHARRRLADGVALRGRPELDNTPLFLDGGRAHVQLARLRGAHRAVPVDARGDGDRDDGAGAAPAVRVRADGSRPARRTSTLQRAAFSRRRARRQRASSRVPGAPFQHVARRRCSVRAQRPRRGERERRRAGGGSATRRTT